MKKFNVGIIGYGWAAIAHINATGHGRAVLRLELCRPRSSLLAVLLQIVGDVGAFAIFHINIRQRMISSDARVVQTDVALCVAPERKMVIMQNVGYAIRAPRGTFGPSCVFRRVRSSLSKRRVIMSKPSSPEQGEKMIPLFQTEVMIPFGSMIGKCSFG